MRKKRVLHLVSSKGYSGAENIVIKIIKSLQKYFDFVYVSPEGPIVDVLNRNNISYLSIKEDDIRSINSVLMKWEPDIIHAHDFRASIKSAISSYSCMKISHLHQNPPWIRQYNLRSISYLLSCLKYDKVVVVSPQILEEIIFPRLVKHKTTIVSNIVDVEEVLEAAKREQVIQAYDIAFFGRLAEVKDPIRFIKIVHQVVRAKKDLRAVMIGDGDLRSECEAMIEKLSLTSNIDLMGFVPNPFPIVNNSKVIVMPSKWEGFGLAAVEAMVLGKPVFSSPVGGLQSIVNEDCGGQCNTDEEFTHKIIKSLDDGAYYELLSKNSRINSRRFGDKEKWASQLMDIYNSNSKNGVT